MFNSLVDKKVLLLTHDNADLDSFCSAAIIKEYLSLKKIPSVIGVPSHINEQAKFFALNEKIDFKINPNLQEFNFVILFDFNNFEQLGKLRESFIQFFEKNQFSVIAFDHHVISEKSICKKNCFIDENAFSTTQVIYTLLGNEFSKKMAFYCCVGLIEDTGHFLVGDAYSFKCFADCLKKSGKTYSNVLFFSRTQVPESEKIAFIKAAQRSKIIKFFSKKISSDVIIVTSKLSFYQGPAATKLLGFGAHIVIVSGKEKSGCLHLAVRVDSELKEKSGFNAMLNLLNLICEKFDGNAGGHSCAAHWRGFANEKKVLLESIKIVKNYFGAN